MPRPKYGDASVLGFVFLTIGAMRVRSCVVHTQTGTLLHYTKAGQPFWNEVTLVPVRVDGAVERFVGTVDDVTARV